MSKYDYLGAERLSSPVQGALSLLLGLDYIVTRKHSQARKRVASC